MDRIENATPLIPVLLNRIVLISTWAQTDDPLYPPEFYPHTNVPSMIVNSNMRPPNPSLTNNKFFIPIVQTTVDP